MMLMLKDDKEIVERYKEYHRKAWPEVVARLREVGIVNRRVYLLGRRMFMYPPGAGARSQAQRLVGPDGRGLRPQRAVSEKILPLPPSRQKLTDSVYEAVMELVMDQHIEAGAQANIDLVAPSWICRRPCA